MNRYLPIDPNLWGDFATIVSAITGTFTFIITVILLQKANNISSYLSKQTDRKIIEEIYIEYIGALRKYSSYLNHSDPKSSFPFWDAYRKAELYDLSDICKKIKEDIDTLDELHILSQRIYDCHGNPTINHNTQDMDKIHELERKLTSEDTRTAVFRKHLKIEDRK